MATKRFSWYISRKSLIELIGAEYHVLRSSGSTALPKFYIAGLAIVVILLLSIGSIFYAMELLFHMVHVELLLSSFIAALFIFIYIFLLNTFSKRRPTDKEMAPAQKRWRGINLTDIVRTGFVAFMAFLISKPLEVYIFRHSLEKEVQKHRGSLLSGYKARIDSLNAPEIGKISRSLAFYEKQYAAYPTPIIEEQTNKLKNELARIQSIQQNNFYQAQSRIDKSDFLLFRIQKVSRKPASWLICLLVTVLFLLPGFLVYSISTDDAYYKNKQARERKLVNIEYKAFERWYTEIFKEYYLLDRSFYTVYNDPPFNTERKKPPVGGSQADFLNKFS